MIGLGKWGFLNVPPNEMEIKEGYGREDKEIYQMIEQVIRD